MRIKTFSILVLCFGLLLSLSAAAQRDPDRRDLRGLNPKRHKYLATVIGGAAVGAGLGFILPGEKTPLKLMLMGGGAGSTWYLYTHRDALGSFHDFAMIGGNTALGWGIGWLGCNCRDGAYAGTLLGGGVTAAWLALENDRAAQNSFHRARAAVRRDNGENDQQQVVKSDSPPED
jgi:hypothetical protein